MNSRTAAALKRLNTPSGTHTEAEHWKRDNRALFEEAAALAGRTFVPRSLRPLTDRMVRTALETCTPPDADSICAAVMPLGLPEDTLAALPAALAGAFLIAAAAHDTDASVLRTACGSLRLILTDKRLSRRILECGTIHRLLLQDCVFSAMHERSQAEYRAALARLARRKRMSEKDAAERVLRLARDAADPRQRHVGYWILRQPLGEKPSSPAALFSLLHILLTLVSAGALSLRCGAWTIAALPSLAVFWEGMLRRAFRRILPVRPLPRMKEAQDRALCVITCLCSSAEKAARLIRRLEEIALSASQNPNVCFGLLADLPEAKKSEAPEDAAILRALQDGIDALNRRSDRPYCIFLRPRSLYPADRRWIPAERKRGAVDALMRLLAGEASELTVHGMQASALAGIPRVITLDEDSRPDIASLDRLLETAEHPLNRPVIRGSCVAEGYGILQPRAVFSPERVVRTRFAALLAGSAGFDRYADGAGEWQTDLTGTCAFTGKGLIDVAAYMAVLKDRFPANAILSHDLPEGELMRTACVTAASFSESFPSDSASYYGRLHRWLRGDVQNLRLLLDPGIRRTAGLRITENAARLLVPVTQLFSLAAAAVRPWLLLPVLACLFEPALFRFRVTGRLKLTRLRVPLFPGPGAEWPRALLRLALLPAEAWTALRAGGQALTRMMFTHRGLLEWAAFSDRAARRSPVPAASFITGAAGLALFGLRLSAASALLPLLTLSPLFVHLLERPNVSRETIPESMAGLLQKDAAEMLSYYTDLCTPENHWLPPDNVQEDGVVTRRTSPTNIGLGMLSLWEGASMGLLPASEVQTLLSHMADSLEAIPRCQGHFPNWIDLRTLEPLRPRWISTADEGNLAVCLLTLVQALPEGDLRRRLKALADAMDFSALYDPETELLYLGFDLDSMQPSRSHYDLMASEARLASYVGIAAGQLPPAHWERLSRVLCVSAGYGGMASWSGTMFEYFLPALFLPAVSGSFWDETLRHALAIQQRDNQNGIWGRSESGYFAFDADLLYQYKAHGCRALARSSAAMESVFAPYAAYLVLLGDPLSVQDLLRRYDGLRMRGRYGLYEAYDCDPRRSPAGTPVRSWMAHHIGMSVLAIAYVLRDGEPQRLLWQDPRFRAFEPLLADRIPYGARAPGIPAASESPKSCTSERYHADLTRLDAFCPRMLVLGLPGAQMLLTDTGASVCRVGRIAVAGLADSGIFRGGLRWSLRYGDRRIPLTYWPYFSEDYRYETEFRGDCAVWHVRTDTLHVRLEVRASPDGPAWQWRAAAESAMTCEALLEVRFEPILAKSQDYLAHPAFSRLFLQAAADDTHCTVFRAARGGSPSAALAFGGTVPARWTLARPDRQGHISPAEGFVLDCEVAMSCPLHLSPSAPFSARFALGYGTDTAAAEAFMREGLALEDGAFRMDEAARVLGMTSEDVSASMDLYAETFFTTSNRRRMAGFLESATESRSALWRAGISGDFPVLAVRVPDERSAERLYELLRMHVFLFACGLIVDCAVLLPDGGEYRRPVYTRARELLDSLDGLNLLDVPGGVHLIGSLSERECSELIANAAVYADCAEGGYPIPQRRLRMLPAVSEPSAPSPVCGSFGARCYSFTGQPPVVWSHVLANRSFGYLATDGGIGFCWHRNARENRLNAWVNDPYAVRGPETIEWQSVGERFSVFSEAGDARVTFGLGYARWEKHRGGHSFSATAFVHRFFPLRLMLFETDAPDAVLHYHTTLELGGDAGRIVTRRVGSGLLAQNPSRHSTAALIASFSRFTCDAQAAAEGRLNGETGAGFAPCFAAEVPLRREPEGFCAVIALGCPANETALSQFAVLTEPDAARRALTETIRWWETLTDSGPFAGASPEMRQYLDGFALYQTIACRLWGRTSLWQNGGAYGFRDQLQDILALLAAPPGAERCAAARTQILRAAAHQYAEGDVQHWWHPCAGRGVRTRISDDLLFLPWLLTKYTRVVRDDLADLRLPYLESPPLVPDEHDRYEKAPRGRIRESVYRHCVRALELVPQRGTGPHGLLRMGSGDWNDGMDAVGGESVWLTWFAAMVYRDFADLGDERGDTAWAGRCRDYAAGLTASAERCFRGSHYLRGYYADGTPLGADEGEACCLDAIAQAFSALAGGDRSHARTALLEAYRRLYDPVHRIVRLFVPPFTQAARENPGYIKAYPPGTRENGGQYTHGAIWLAWGLYEAGLFEEADRIMSALCPTDRDTAVYRAEPWALCADVYAPPAPAGQGGWSLYTGAASWYYAVARTWLQKPGHEKASDLI